MVCAIPTGKNMNSTERSEFSSIGRWFIGLVILLMLLGGAATLISRVFNLAWLPWQMQMETNITRSSNGYVTAQQEFLRQLRTDYDAAAPDQKRAIRRQMTETADKIPDNVQPDIAAFLTSR